MEIFLRLYGCLSKIINLILRPFLIIIYGGFKTQDSIPKPTSPIFNICAVDLAEKIRKRELSSEQVVREYIKRIRLVEPFLNAVIEDRFEDAINDAKKADKIIAETSSLIYVIKNYPLLGVPFTVKESIAVKGMSHVSGMVWRKGLKATRDAVVVEKMRAAGAIPLLVSTTPEYCLSWECHSLIHGRTHNPYDLGRSSGGSSGGEGALLGAGASLFGLGSDIAGSIRVPGHFNGIFAHKPTAEIISIDGHFPHSQDRDFQKYLTIGPMCRFARDLPTLTWLMADEKFHNQLRLDQPILTKDIKIFYQSSAGYSLSVVNVESSIQNKILEAVEHFKRNGVTVEPADFGDMQETLEISVATLFSMESLPDLMLEYFGNKKDQKENDIWTEIGKSLIGKSDHSFNSLYFFAIYKLGALIRPSKRQEYIEKGIKLRQKIIEKLDTNGVFFYPTFPQPALRHHESTSKLSGVMYTMFFNVMGFPSTHVPMGKDKNGLPIGFQIIAGPYQDRNCFAIARELEAAFGGWSL